MALYPLKAILGGTTLVQPKNLPRPPGGTPVWAGAARPPGGGPGGGAGGGGGAPGAAGLLQARRQAAVGWDV